MTTNFRDPKVLRAVSPLALSAYARFSGWTRTDVFGDYSDVYTGFQLPEIIIPRTQHLGDYAQVVHHLISTFAKVAEVDDAELYYDLVVADRDVTRVKVNDGDTDGTIDLEQGTSLVNGSRAMWLAAACSLQEHRSVYRSGANRDAVEYLSRMRIGQTERGSFVITLLSPVIPPPVQVPLMPEWELDDPVERQITRRMGLALSAVRDAASKAVGGDTTAFGDAVPHGASANLCEALVQMIEPFTSLNVSTTWARTRPLSAPRQTVRFWNEDALILREAARSYRSREPRLDVKLFGSVQILKRDYSEAEGTVTLRATIDGRVQSVAVGLSESDYHRASQANLEKVPIVIEGDLERVGQRWRLSNSRITEVISGDDDGDPAGDTQNDATS